MKVTIFVLGCALLLAQPTAAQTTKNAADTQNIFDQTALFGEDDLLLFEIDVGGQQLTDSLPAYSSRAGLFIPLGEFSRLLDLAIIVDPPAQKAQGWFLSEDRSFLLDLHSHHATVAGKDYDVPATYAVLYHGEIFVRADLLQQLLPVSLTIDKSNLLIKLSPRERFPFQDRLEREKRREGLSNEGTPTAQVMHVPPTYALFTPPAVDLALNGMWSNHAPQASENYNLRLAGDLAYADMQLFVGSDNSARPVTASVLLRRKDPDGQIAGFFGATRSDAGDIFTPALDIGVASISGRGVMTTSQPLDQASVFSTTDIRGPLPAGDEVELYVNEVLRGSTAQAVLGNYEFLSVPLSYGLNIIRLVFYGPHGERNEEVRRINVGNAQLTKDQIVYSLAAAQQYTPVIEINKNANSTPGIQGLGSIRAVGSLSYGLTDAITLTGGFAQYTPDTTIDYGQRQMVEGGVSTSLLGFATELNAAGDNRGGFAFAAGMGGHIFDISVLARHSEYLGGFVDELQTLDLFSPSPLKRASQLTADWAPTLPLTDLTVPISLHGEESQYVDHSWRLLASANISTTVGRYNFSAGWQYQETASAQNATTIQSIGTLAASALVWRSWQLRADATFGAVPKLQIDTAELVIDGRFTDDISLRLDAQQSFAQITQVIGTTPIFPVTNPVVTGPNTTTITAALTWRLSRFDITFDASYTPQLSQTQIGVQLNLGALFDPITDDYRLVRTGAASGGNVALDAFIDKNGDGVREPGEPGVPGIVAQGGNYPATSDDNGEILLSGLGDGAHARIHVDPQSIPDPYLTAPPDTIEVVPHPGQVEVIAYPLRSLGEAAVRIFFVVAGSPPRGLSALQVQLVSQTGVVVAEGRSEYDGTVLFERVPPGSYALRIEPDQSQKLKLVLTGAVHVTVPVGGGYVGGTTATVTRQ